MMKLIFVNFNLPRLYTVLLRSRLRSICFLIQELLAADSVNVEVCQLDWGSKSDESAILKEHGQFELIVGSDIILSSFEI